MKYKNSSEADITRMVISTPFVIENMHNFFPDSIILDRHFNILAVSKEILFRLKYEHAQLNGRHFSLLNKEIINTLQQKLLPGYFAKFKVTLVDSTGKHVQFFISGFYLGILSNCSDVLVLRLEDNAEVQDLNKRLARTVEEVDAFIYRTAHDLRGPLATIQGILNLFKIRKDDSEVNYFITLIDAQCNKLDERLKNINYLAKSNEEFSAPSFVLHLPALETSLRKALERNSFVDAIQLSFSGAPLEIVGYNEELVTAALSNILMYFATLAHQIDSEISVDVNETNAGLEVLVSAYGFEIDGRMCMVLRNPEVSYYVDILQSSRFAYLFAAAKISAKIKASLHPELLTPAGQRITFFIPTPDNH